MTFESILVPTDFSQCAGWALEQAIAIARESGAHIDLAHSTYVPNLHDVSTPPDVELAIRNAGTQRLAALVERVEQVGIDVHQHLLAETPTVAIQQLAERRGTDCIIMGTRGLTGLKHVVLGSIAERTLRIAPCPVLTVGQAPQPGSAMPRKLLVPTDFSETAECATAMVRRLLGDRRDAEIVLLHVYARPIAAGPYAFAVQDDFIGLRTRITDALEAIAEEVRSDGFTASVRVEEARSAAVEIARVAEDEACDWIVLGTHGRTGLSHLALGSVAEKVVRAAVCPTLTVKQTD